MTGHKMKEHNKRLWKVFNAKLPALWKEFQRLANTTPLDRIVINIRVKPETPATPPEPSP